MRDRMVWTKKYMNLAIFIRRLLIEFIDRVLNGHTYTNSMHCFFTINIFFFKFIRKVDHQLNYSVNEMLIQIKYRDILNITFFLGKNTNIGIFRHNKIENFTITNYFSPSFHTIDCNN